MDSSSGVSWVRSFWFLLTIHRIEVYFEHFLRVFYILYITFFFHYNSDHPDFSQLDRLVYGSGNVWLRAIVGTCAYFYLATVVGIIIRFTNFSGCAENTWIITLTLLGIVTLIIIQLSGSEDSLLTNTMISLYVTYLA